MNGKTLITGCMLLRDSGTELMKDWFVSVEGTTIASLGPMNSCPEADGFTVIDGRSRLLMPGLVNGHNHSAMTLFRGIADDLNLHDWLHDHIFPAEAAHVSEEMVYWCTKLAAAEKHIAAF